MGLEVGPEYGGPGMVSDREVDDDFWGATIRENGVGANALVDGVRRRARSEEESFIFL
jgi:hypothetical protein